MAVVQTGGCAVRVWSPTGVRLSSALLQAKRIRMGWAEKGGHSWASSSPQPVRVAWVEK